MFKKICKINCDTTVMLMSLAMQSIVKKYFRKKITSLVTVGIQRILTLRARFLAEKKTAGQIHSSCTASQI